MKNKHGVIKQRISESGLKMQLIAEKLGMTRKTLWQKRQENTIEPVLIIKLYLILGVNPLLDFPELINYKGLIGNYARKLDLFSAELKIEAEKERKNAAYVKDFPEFEEDKTHEQTEEDMQVLREEAPKGSPNDKTHNSEVNPSDKAESKDQIEELRKENQRLYQALYDCQNKYIKLLEERYTQMSKHA